MSKPVTLDPADEQRMSQYANQANDNHRAAMDAEGSALKYARAAGDALCQAKVLLGHRNWCAWLKENFKASDRTANSYMRLAEKWDKLEPLLESDHIPLSIRGALRLLKRGGGYHDRIDDDHVAEHGFPNLEAEIRYVERKFQEMLVRSVVPKITPRDDVARFVWWHARDDWQELLSAAISQFQAAVEERLGEPFKAWQAGADEDEDDVATIPVPRRRERLSA